MRAFKLKLFVFLYILLVIASFVGILIAEYVEHDYYVLEMATRKDNTSDTRRDKFKTWFARKRIKKFGFSDKCSIQISSQGDTSAIYVLTEKSSESGVDKKIVLGLIKDLNLIGCSVNVYNEQAGLLPLHVAIIRGDIDALKLLLKLGADINLVSKREKKLKNLNALDFTLAIIEIKKNHGESYANQLNIHEILKNHK
ncbi:MAG: hypothetical protein V3U71_11090 [Cocleimonas sp.]